LAAPVNTVDYVCPVTHEPLTFTADGWRRPDGRTYPRLATPIVRGSPIPDFSTLHEVGEGSRASLQMYATGESEAVYQNFLDWMFATFRTTDAEFRAVMAGKLRPIRGGKVLITGCGLGDDILAILDVLGPDGVVCAQDLSPAMVAGAWRRLSEKAPDRLDRVFFSVCDATRLPFPDGAFDAAYHFGGLNLFDDPAAGIAEMRRVVRQGGRVLISDEGVAPWLKDTSYGRMVVTNNALWAHDPPLERLPLGICDLNLSWVLGDCFWVIEFTVSEGFPDIDPHVPHKGRRGGSMWIRHTGQLEPVTPETRAEVIEAAARAGVSVHDWLERAVRRALDD
jgi:SAM-dependent methyltransferase